MAKVEKTICTFLGVLFVAFGAAPALMYGIFHTGVAVLVLLGFTLLMLASWLHKPRYQVHCRVVLVLLSVVLAVALVLYCFMAQAAKPPKQYPQQSVLLIPGAAVTAEGPSPVLKSRLDTALAYINEHPDTRVIVTGGNASSTHPAEAEVMRSYLASRGMDWDEILIEKASTNTSDNMRLSAAVLKENGIWQKDVIIVTDAPHQLRCGIYAVRTGLTPHPLPSRTPLLMRPAFWVREMVGVLWAFIK